MIMECREVRQLAESFVTEQLLVETMQAVVAHRDRCPPCRAEIEGLRRLRAGLRAAFDASDDLRARPELAGAVRERLRSTPGRGARRTALSQWVAIAAMVTILAGGGFALRGWSGRGLTALLRAAAGDHQFCALTYKLTERPIPLAEAARRYGAVNAALETVQPSSAALSGGPVRVLERHSCLYDGRRFAHIVVGYKGRAVSILVAEKDTMRGALGPGPSTGAGVSAMPATAGFHVVAFRASGRMVFVVSALDAADVQEVAQAMIGPVSRAMAGA